MLDKKYLREIENEVNQAMGWARTKAKERGTSPIMKVKYKGYYYDSRMELAGLYLLEGRTVNLTGYEEYLPLIPALYNNYTALIATNKKLLETTNWPELVNVRIKKYRYIKKGLKLLNEKLKKEVLRT